MKQKTIAIISGISGGFAVMIGAFGAHGLKNILSQNNSLDTFETSVKYHFYHTIILVIIATLNINKFNKQLSLAALFFLLGIIFFSGSLYILSITNLKFLGAITPIGGCFFILGWIYTALGISK